MIRYPDYLIKNIRQIRLSKRTSYYELSRKFAIPSGTIRNWCHEEGLSRKDALTKTYQAKRDKIKALELDCVPDTKTLSKSQAKFIAGVLYGCEGAKYPSSNRVDFTNSDPYLISTFIELLQKGFNINPEKIIFRLQIHTNQSFEKLKRFWIQTTRLRTVKFMKPTITSPLGGKHRPIYYGTCTVRYNDYSLQLKLLGIFEKFIQVK